MRYDLRPVLTVFFASTAIPLACASGSDTTNGSGFDVLATTGTTGAGAGGASSSSSSSSSQSGGDVGSASSSSDASTAGSGGAGGAGGAGGSGGVGAGGGAMASSASAGGSMNTCKDTGHEPNESDDAAFDVSKSGMSDCDGEGGTIKGVLNGTSDEDWFKYSASDDTFCTVDPTRKVTPEVAIRICKYFECWNGKGNAKFDCPSGTTSDTSPKKMLPGCCGAKGFSIDLSCGGDDSANVYIRVDTTQQNACIAYSIDYHF